MVFDASRAVEIFASPQGYGSGYRVTTLSILTCAHIFESDAQDATVRDLRGHVASATLAWRSSALDLALLQVDVARSDGHYREELVPTTLGWIGTSIEGTLSYTMLGWPRVGAAIDGAGRNVRDPVQVVGEIKLAEVAGARTHAIRLRPDDNFPPLAEGSWWEGMSGAGVFCNDLLVAVQVAQSKREVTNFLSACVVGARSLDVAPDELQTLLTAMADQGVHCQPALDPHREAIQSYVEDLDHRLADLPTWFPQSLRRDARAIDRLSQSPVLVSPTQRELGSKIELAQLSQEFRVVVVEGEAGAGKTWALRSDARAAAQAARTRLRDGSEGPLIVPILCQLSDVDEQTSSLDDLIGDALARSTDGGLVRSGVRHLVGQGSALLRITVDGFDEATRPQQEILARAVDEALWGTHPELSVLIIGTRPGELVAPRDTRLLLLHVDGFGPIQQSALISAWFDGASPSSADAVRALSADWRVAEAFRNPLTLSLACIAIQQPSDRRPTALTVADIFRAAIDGLVDEAHRSTGIRLIGRRSARRFRGRVLDALARLGSRCFRTGTFQLALTDDQFHDIGDDELNACLDTGLFVERSPEGIAAANRSLATYLAAQHVAMSDDWRDVLEQVWDSNDLAEIAALVPHSMIGPLAHPAQHMAVDAWFDEVDRLASLGDPGFVLLHVACRAIALLGARGIEDARRDHYIRVLRAHVLTALDMRAGESLARVAPEALAAILQRIDSRLGRNPDDGICNELRQLRSDLALDLANAGYTEGFTALETAIRDQPNLNVSFACAVLEWLLRQGDSRGVQVVERMAEDGPPTVRMGACVLLAARDKNGYCATIASAFADCNARPFVEYSLEVAGVLHELGNDAGTDALRARLADDRDWRALQAMSWLGADEASLAEPLLIRLTEPGQAWGPAIVAAEALGPRDPERAASALRWITNRWEVRMEAVFAAVTLIELDLDRELGLQCLSDTAVRGEPSARVFSAVTLSELDPEDDGAALDAIARSDDLDVKTRVAAVRLLETVDADRAAGALQHARDAGTLEFEQALADVSLLDEVTSRAFRPILYDAMMIHRLEETPGERLLRVADSLRELDDIRPSDCIPGDPIEQALFGPRPDPEAGIAPQIDERLDLSRERDRRILALTLPLFDYPGDRQYLAASGKARSPTDDWLLWMTDWCFGDYSGTTESAEQNAVWADAIQGAIDVFDMSPDWMMIAFSDPGWISNRCLPLVFRFATDSVLLELSHRLPHPAPWQLGAALVARTSIRGLSRPTTRACVGRACLQILVETDTFAEDDPDVATTKELYKRRIEQLECAHH